MKNAFIRIGVIALIGGSVLLAQVPAARIAGAAGEPGNWLTYSGNYNGHRHSALAQIDTKNVARLKPAWVYQSREAGKIETSPIVVDGAIYITEKPHIVTALDGRTGRPIWSYRRPAAENVPACCGAVNRGAAVLDDALYHLTFDAKLVALDLKSGKPRWEVVVADPKLGYSCTVAPLAVKDKIIVGISGGEFGIRGFLDAYDAKTGERAWRFWTIPGPGEPHHETWESDSWKSGGAPTWVTGSFDPELNLIYWGTGNPAPDYNGDDREGDNLYSCSLLAIDADTGKLRWHFQFTPHDTHDWDSNQVPMLVEGVIDGRPRKLVVQANRNGFYYVLDRVTGKFLRGVPYVRQTWTDGLDAQGRPHVRPGTEPTPEGTLVYPGFEGATNWFSPSYHPGTRLVYVQAMEDFANVYYKLKEDYRVGQRFESGGTRTADIEEAYGVVKALEVETGKLRWQFKLHAEARGGVLSTAGGLVFSGNAEGAFFALDAETGKPLWHFQTGGQIWANPVTFLIQGKQHVAIAAGQGIFVFAL
jgi:alcohol dehydrogenase (cytochrome c)